MTRAGVAFRRLMLGGPWVWAALFFLLPLAVIVKISFAETAVGVPPYTPLFVHGANGVALQATLSNYHDALSDSFYAGAYIGSLKIAAIATVIALLIGYPMAYAIVAAPRHRRGLLLLLVALPFWTSLLVRVYAWMGLLRPGGVINTLLLDLGLIGEPLHLINTTGAVCLGMVYAYLPFMVLPLYARLERPRSFLAGSRERSWGKTLAGLPRGDIAVVAARHHRRRAAGVHPLRRRIRHPRFARGARHGDDRQSPVERVLLQPRLAFERGADSHHGGRAGDPHSPAAAADRGRGRVMKRISWLTVALGAGLAFLYLPLAMVILYSFNASRLVTVWTGFSTQWYGELLRDRQLVAAAGTSLIVGVLSATLAVIVGTAAGYALQRFGAFKGRWLFSTSVVAPLVMPDVITGLSLLLLFVAAQGAFPMLPGRGIATIVIAHASFTTATVALIVQARLAGMERDVEEAASDLGARPWTVFTVITLPMIAPALAAGWLLAFVLSLDDVVIASFVAGPQATTLPMVVYSSIRLGVSPKINALAALLVVVTGILLGLAALLARNGRKSAA
jgi:putrescine transport system permease protein